MKKIALMLLFVSTTIYSMDSPSFYEEFTCKDGTITKFNLQRLSNWRSLDRNLEFVRNNIGLDSAINELDLKIFEKEKNHSSRDSLERMKMTLLQQYREKLQDARDMDNQEPIRVLSNNPISFKLYSEYAFGGTVFMLIAISAVLTSYLESQLVT